MGEPDCATLWGCGLPHIPAQVAVGADGSGARDTIIGSDHFVAGKFGTSVGS
jgi:hypothetical protein